MTTQQFLTHQDFYLCSTPCTLHIYYSILKQIGTSCDFILFDVNNYTDLMCRMPLSYVWSTLSCYEYSRKQPEMAGPTSAYGIFFSYMLHGAYTTSVYVKISQTCVLADDLASGCGANLNVERWTLTTMSTSQSNDIPLRRRKANLLDRRIPKPSYRHAAPAGSVFHLKPKSAAHMLTVALVGLGPISTV